MTTEALLALGPAARAEALMALMRPAPGHRKGLTLYAACQAHGLHYDRLRYRLIRDGTLEEVSGATYVPTRPSANHRTIGTRRDGEM